MPLAAVDWGLMLEVVWVSMLAGVGITTIFSVVIFSGARASDARRENRGAVAGLYGVVTGAASLLFLAGVAYGVWIILDK